MFKLRKHTNLVINDASCLCVVYIMEYPVSHVTIITTQSTVGNALKWTSRDVCDANMADG
jgi:hypothetical protein